MGAIIGEADQEQLIQRHAPRTFTEVSPSLFDLVLRVACQKVTLFTVDRMIVIEVIIIARMQGFRLAHFACEENVRAPSTKHAASITAYATRGGGGYICMLLV